MPKKNNWKNDVTDVTDVTDQTPVASENAEESPKLTPEQMFRRRQWANILCQNAANETSRAMARRLCQSWFPTCHCHREN